MKLEKTEMKFFLAIPHLISLLNLSFGFIAILLILNGIIQLSSILIMLAVVCDSIDGWLGRKIGIKDEHGFTTNIDSLADVVSFGIAPGILLYSIGKLYSLEISLLAAVISLFVAICGVLRLTRFNVMVEKLDYGIFIGLPIPTVGFLLSTFILSGFFNIYLSLVLMIAIGILMISNVKYPKFSNIKIITFSAILILLIIIFYLLNLFEFSSISLLAINIFATILFVLTAGYVLYHCIKDLYS